MYDCVCVQTCETALTQVVQGMFAQIIYPICPLSIYVL